MKKLLVGLILLTSTMGAADEVKPRQWSVGLGPVLSGALLGLGGTKFGLHLAYVKQLSERIDSHIWFDGAYNTASLGTSQSSGIGYGVNIFTKDRGAETSPFIIADLGYGGVNDSVEASIIGALGLGIEFFRKNEAAVSVYYRRSYTLTSRVTGTGANFVSQYPYYDSLMVAVNF